MIAVFLTRAQNTAWSVVPRSGFAVIWHLGTSRESRLCLKFVAAVSVSCSGDKSDKEESAGSFAMLWGFCVTAAVVDWQSVRLNDDSQRKYVDFPEMT